jgi:hypothetical protein
VKAGSARKSTYTFHAVQPPTANWLIRSANGSSLEPCDGRAGVDAAALLDPAAVPFLNGLKKGH